jgi:prepilin-type N-terminal cleavage/methylation domain-containing protein
MLLGKYQKGFTLLELLITVTILAIIMTFGVPNLFGYLDRKRVEGAAHTFLSNVQFARAESIKQNKNVYIELDSAAWCYGITDSASAATCDCSVGTGCTLDGVNYLIDSSSYPDVGLVTSMAGTTISFDPIRGTMGPSGSLYFSNADGSMALRVILSPLGRAKLCATSGSSWGYDEC